MELDSLFSMPRWKILELLARSPNSPLEISKILSTSVAYISQQLKLLEAAGIIFKERTKSVEKGKARNIYHLSSESLNFTALFNNSPIRKSIKPSVHQKAIIKIWTLVDPRFVYFVERIFWQIEGDLEDIKTILVESGISRANIIIISDSKKVKQKVESLSKKDESIINLQLVLPNNMSKFFGQKYFAIHDPQMLFEGNNNLKGGNFKGEI